MLTLYDDVVNFIAFCFVCRTGVIGRPFFLSPGHVASTSEIIEGFNSIFDANGRGIAVSSFLVIIYVSLLYPRIYC